MGRPPITQITEADFRQLVRGGRVLQGGGVIPDVVLDASGERLVKVIRRARGFSSDRLWPYGYRFVSNCKKLLALGIEAPRLERYMVIRESGLHVLTYRYMPGKSVKDHAESGHPVDEKELAAFFVELHGKGVYFRSIHPGNILRLADGRFALIDVTDVRFYPGPLSVRRRTRNLLYACTRDRIRHVYPPDRLQALLNSYYQFAALPTADEAKLKALLQRGLVGGK